MGNNPEINARKWDSRAETYDNKIFDLMRYMQKRVIDVLPLEIGIKFLDLGCGTGWAVREVDKRCNNLGEFYGVDISPIMVQIATAYSRENPNIFYKLGNAEELPISDSSINLLICTNSFHHYQNPEKAIGEMKRVLLPEGLVYIMDLTDDNIFVSWFNRFVSKIEAAHVKFYSTRDYRRMFSDAGFEVDETQSIFGSMKIHKAKKP
jgi:ubiquinone/menaquinone biosynthesis C-methylase UbiE